MQPPTVSSSEYTDDYYRTACQGHSEFIESNGSLLPLRLSIPLSMASIRPNTKVLDIGCGRGEIVMQAALKGALAFGIDYSESAIRIADEFVKATLDVQYHDKINLRQCDARNLPFETDSMDVVLMLDVVEHLYPDELHQALCEINRVLKPDGKLIIHTMPNLWYYHIGYPLFRFFSKLRGSNLPANPRERFPYNHLHVNEQTPLKLKNYLNRSRYQSKVWMQTTVDYSYEKNILVRQVMEFLVKAPLLNLIFCNDIFAISQKKD